MGLPLPFETDPEIAKTVFTTAMTCLVGSMRCQAISLSPLSELAPGVAAIRSCIGDAGLETAAEDWSGRHTVMRLPDSFDAWLESLSKSRRREYRKDLGKLAERGALSMRTTTALTLADRLQAFAEMHTAQWREVGKAGHFGDWPDALPFGRLVSASLAPSGRASIDEHWCEKTLLSAQYGFRQGSRAYWRLIARTLDPDLRKFGVGRVGLVERVRHLIADGVQMVEAGSGEYDYKLNYGGELVPIGRLVLSSRKARGRVRLLLRAASLLDLVYYRFWFLKVAPQIRRLTGLAPRPLWRTWRKTRL
jgi:CelD/BcsL family acetyltransferase involved in cellulose biosynthesis